MSSFILIACRERPPSSLIHSHKAACGASSSQSISTPCSHERHFRLAGWSRPHGVAPGAGGDAEQRARLRRATLPPRARSHRSLAQRAEAADADG
eukprot:1701138-Pleurochrysis_carterae.AAC.1